MRREELISEDFNYELPEERIAKYPLENRNQSKLLSFKNGKIEEGVFSNLQHHLPTGAALVFNDTKVLAARLHFQKKTGARIEIFCLEPFEQTVEQSLTATQHCVWQCMVGNLKRFKRHDVLALQIAGTLLKARILEKKDDAVLIRFDWTGGIAFSAILEEAGEIPLPPYLNRLTENKDRETYQTVYAAQEGAVAAPTAGLHFVQSQLSELNKRGHSLLYLTLFVGAGTFKAVKTERLIDHKMHDERIVVQKKTLKQLAVMGEKLIAVGTTSLRSLESMYWLAVKMQHTGNNYEDRVTQEDAYQLESSCSWEEACNYLISVMEKEQKETLDFHSALFIMPGYRWKAIKGLITNFHQPKSTLLALVASWVGRDWEKIYQYALQNNFRFLSYGDSSILFNG